MHPELAEPLRELGWAAPREYNDPFHDVDLAAEELDEELPTFREAPILSRVGQGLFREQLWRYRGACAVTGASCVEVLRASHIKPWRHASNRERLDPYTMHCS